MKGIVSDGRLVARAPRHHEDTRCEGEEDDFSQGARNRGGRVSGGDLDPEHLEDERTCDQQSRHAVEADARAESLHAFPGSSSSAGTPPPIAAPASANRT